MQGWLLPVILMKNKDKYTPWPVDLVDSGFPLEVAIRFKEIRREMTTGLRKRVRDAKN